MTSRRQWIKGASALMLPAALCAQTRKFPERSIRFVVPFSAGGGGDLVARFLAQRLSERIGQSVVVENRVGAGGNIGSDYVLKSAADGYTLLNMSSTYPIQAAVSKLPFDPIADMQAIAMISRDPSVIVVGSNSPYKTLAQLGAAAKREPGKLSYGSAGVGSLAHLGMEEFAFQMGIKLIHIPYKGTSQAFTDVVSGSVDMMLSSATFCTPFIKSGRLIGLGVVGKERLINLPDLKTFAELGLPDYSVFDWKALAGPKGMPADVVTFLNQEVNAILRDRATAAKFEEDGTKLVGGSPEQMMETIRADVIRWKRVATTVNIKVE
jgi:tripartite-type tricarboxylate transporter receptor subunit TctC